MTHQTVQIEEVCFSNPNHAEALVQLLNEYASSPGGGGCALSDFARSQLASELGKRQHAHALLAWVGGCPAGLIVAFEGFSTFQCRPLLNIHDVIVSEAYRGRGLSKRLFEEAEAMARRLGCCKLTLEVLDGNHVAKKAYASMGFSGYELDPQFGKALFWEKKL
jgi:GNAT superfamily N-acetyltransferase